MLKLTTKPFTSCVLCNLLIHMQNNSLRSSQMGRKQNFKVVFGFKCGTAVLTFPFRFLSSSFISSLHFGGKCLGKVYEGKSRWIVKQDFHEETFLQFLLDSNWDFVREISNLALQVLELGGKFYSQVRLSTR